ncbi:hypothetical protein C8J56DRAFT_1043014 [Mycena floridula]|nr:hypothetical protein C8J56DRAFT_1043014 [Mycena floridula]
MMKVSAAGTIFHAPYNSLAPLCSILPSLTVWVIVTGTTTTTVTEAVAIVKQLGFQKDHFINARYASDRPNITLLPYINQHALTTGTFMDLSFLVLLGLKSIDELVLTVLFCSQIHTRHGIMTFLDSLFPELRVPKLV